MNCDPPANKGPTTGGVSGEGVEPGADGGVVFAQAGWREVGLAGAGVRVVVEADRRAGELDPAEGGVLDLYDETLGTGLLPVVDLVECAYLAGRDSQHRKAFQPGVSLVGGERRLDQPDQLVAVRDPVRVAREPFVIRIEPGQRGERAPLRLAPDRYLHAVVGRPEQPVRRDL